MVEQVDVKLKTYHWTNQIQSYEKLVHDEESKLNVDQGIKLGWIEGVLNPCLLSIWGVMLFLRMPWIVGQAGIFDSILIIFISLVIIVITTFSLSAISTNGRVKGGGLYFIISRSIGPEFGASIGILLALANTILVALNTIGFCLSLKSLLHTFDIYAMDSNFIFILTGFIAILIMGVLCGVGMDDEAKIQNILLVFIVGAIFDVLIGSFIGPTNDAAIASGFTGFSMKTFKENWYSHYTDDQTFFTIFAVFFPSVTGIQAGANISGDLKDPSSAIPKGTLLSILITITSYVVLVVVPGAVQLREASGNPNEILNEFYLNCSFRNCTQGLYNNENLMQTISLWPYLIYLGCFAATLSTALTALIAVPKILQRMGQDDIYPFLKYLAKGYGKSNEPYRAHFLAIVISSIFLLIGELNAIASFISTIYLCAYALLNLCTFHVAHFQPLGWRPSYKFYNKWLSLAGAIICFLVMIFIDKQMSVIVGCVIWILYTIAAGKKDDINWGSSRQIQQIKTVIKNIYMADTIQQHVKNYVPNVMVLSGDPESRKELVYFAHIITKNNGLQMCINVIKDPLIHKPKKVLLKKGVNWLNQTGIKSLYNVLDNIDLDIGVHIINSCGHGILKPNIILLGYKHGWFNSTDDDIQTYLNILNLSNMDGIAAIIVRLPMTDTTIESKDIKLAKTTETQFYENEKVNSTSLINEEEKYKAKEFDCSVKMHNTQFSFLSKRNNGTVDVWWLFDDGGLALIIAHIFKSCDVWKKCKFRIFGVTDQLINVDTEKNKLKQLLSMYRVQFDFIDVVLAKRTSLKTMANFTTLWNQQFINQENQQQDDEKYNKQTVIDTLYVKDLLETYSMQSDLIIISSSKTTEKLDQIHMYWMEVITRGLPPCILIHGNTIQTVTASA
ncbi:bumetanide-sensitive sodium-(potassium)-chloride cotransporter-like [Metopolophium dirhodum]|uniref:bumetanide-sensitive sodium-(potassium)-chloride cotransporter-like n=1 Tax=Metopolophium dirhodum TaxID=44670 RepID=UPI00298F4E48|nr:bumetanide-sensitive sodium-(potassium)-chloride cotransporter-like [Metopolophium dirhodum]XP_060864759.1 bumetanide-sensitive sodium-(potassium)-chloride cotransporter-like [Metopolophium dirhodum]